MAGGILTKVPIQSTSGAITIRNLKGELATEKVKVNRYVTGKRPEYAPESSSEDDSDIEINLERKRLTERKVPEAESTETEITDRRLRRLQQREAAEGDEDDDDDDDRLTRHRRRVIEPEVVYDDTNRGREVRREDEESSEEELEEDEMERRRALLRKRALERREEEEVLNIEGEKSDVESEESSESESEYDSEQETGPRLKPVFVRKKDRVTIQEKMKQEQHKQEMEIKAKAEAEERRRQSVKMVEEHVKTEKIEERGGGQPDASDLIDSGDEKDEEEYAAWKVRELKRIKRDRDERDMQEKDKEAVERVRNMTDEERRQDLRHNPRVITNKASKGKYKFLQKYYHRGAFYLNEEETVYTRDFTSATLEDHFDRTILPKVMQVKNFGRSGRTKYTHLVDQDTTNYDSPWLAETSQNIKFHTTKGGGMKQSFGRPSVKAQK